PSAKALLNLADCELRLGDVADARVHAVAGLDLARQRHDDELAAVAQGQIDAVDAAQAAAARNAPPPSSPPQPAEPSSATPPAVIPPAQAKEEKPAPSAP